jgi:hypothetical protein
MPKTTQACAVCGQVFTRYTTQARPAVVCGRACHYVRLSQDPKRKLNLIRYCHDPEHQRRAANTNVEQRRLKLRKRGEGYAKYYGKHEHRVIAEQKLGRVLRPGELVHHEDENKQNNSDDNLTVVTRAEHLNIHRTRVDGFNASRLTRVKAVSIRALYAAGGHTYGTLAKDFNVCASTVGAVVRGELWK